MQSNRLREGMLVSIIKSLIQYSLAEEHASIYIYLPVMSF